MEIALRKYFWILNLVTITLCSVFAARAAGRFMESAVATAAKRKVSIPPPPMDPSLATATQRDITQVLARNVFCSNCKPLVETPAANSAENSDPNGEPSSDAAVKTALNIKLVATLVSDSDSAYSYAAILNVTDSKTGMFSIGSKVEGATVTDILQRRVLLLNSGRNEYLDLLETAATAVASAPTPSPRPFSRYRMPRSQKGLEAVARLDAQALAARVDAVRGRGSNLLDKAIAKHVLPQLGKGRKAEPAP